MGAFGYLLETNDGGDTWDQRPIIADEEDVSEEVSVVSVESVDAELFATYDQEIKICEVEIGL